MGTDAQTQEGDRKGPVRRRHKAGKAAGLCSRGVPQQPALGDPPGPLLSSLPQAASLLQSSHQHLKVQAQTF